MNATLDQLGQRTAIRLRLEKEQKKETVQVPLKEVPISDLPRPDAIVLCTIETICERCGAVHRYPSHHLLLRHGKNYTHSGRSVLLLFANVPKEHILKRDQAPSCDKCFGAAVSMVFD